MVKKVYDFGKEGNTMSYILLCDQIMDYPLLDGIVAEAQQFSSGIHILKEKFILTSLKLTAMIYQTKS